MALPPLREHREVILRLADYYLEQYRQSQGLPPRTLGPDARSALLAWSWPDNIQEPDNVLERALLLRPDTTITAAHLDIDLACEPYGTSPPSWWIGPTPGPCARASGVTAEIDGFWCAWPESSRRPSD